MLLLSLLLSTVKWFTKATSPAPSFRHLQEQKSAGLWLEFVGILNINIQLKIKHTCGRLPLFMLLFMLIACNFGDTMLPTVMCYTTTIRDGNKLKLVPALFHIYENADAHNREEQYFPFHLDSPECHEPWIPVASIRWLLFCEFTTLVISMLSLKFFMVLSFRLLAWICFTGNIHIFFPLPDFCDSNVSTSYDVLTGKLRRDHNMAPCESVSSRLYTARTVSSYLLLQAHSWLGIIPSPLQDRQMSISWNK